jgi:hypothetical protein
MGSNIAANQAVTFRIVKQCGEKADNVRRNFARASANRPRQPLEIGKECIADRLIFMSPCARAAHALPFTDCPRAALASVSTGP